MVQKPFASTTWPVVLALMCNIGILYSQTPLASPMAEPFLISGSPGESWARTVLLDVNDDGHLDLIKSIRNSGRLTVNLNLGTGEFGPESMLFDNLNQIIDIHVTDINLDGRDDVMLLSYGNQTMYACMRQADSSLGFPEPVTSVLQESYGCTSGDVNGDGFKDAIALSRNAHHAYWIPFQGTEGEFGTTMHTITNRTYPASGSTVDFDSDGDTDVLVAHHNGQGVWAYVNNGNGTSWGEVNILPGGDAANQTSVIQLGNVTYVFALLSGSIRYAKWAAGSWTSGTISTVNNVSSFAALQSGGIWTVWASHSNLLTKLGSTSSLTNWETLHSPDIGRTYNYLLPPTNVSSASGEKLIGSTNPYQAWAHSTTDLTQSASLTTNGLSGGFPMKFVQADADQEKEIVARSHSSLMLFNRLPSGYWDGGTAIMNGVPVTHLDAVDLDSDGDEELLLGSNTEDRVAWIECLGNSTYSAVRTLSFSAQAIDVEWRDVNGDGAYDATCVTNDDNELLVWYQNPTSTSLSFYTPVDLASNINVIGILAMAWGDINQDGKEDVVITTDGQPVYLGLQQTGNSFEWNIIASYSGSMGARVRAFDVAVFDLFEDGYPEIFFGSWDLETSFANNTDGIPSNLRAKYLSESNPHVFLSSSGVYCRTLDVVDIDNDGKKELITCRDNAPDGVYALQFEDALSPSAQINLIPNVYQGGAHHYDWNIRGAAWDDSDGDGDLDLACVKPATGELYFVENLLESVGCTNPIAVNFDSSATINDHSCLVLGDACDDGNSLTYNDAIQSDGACAGQSFNGSNVLRINCGYTPGITTDTEGNAWSPETNLVIGGGNLWGGGVANNPNDLIMGHARYDLVGYNLPVPSPGQYLLRLHFAGLRSELNATGQEVFHVIVEGDTAVAALDMFVETNNRRANHFAIEHFTQTLDNTILLRLPVVTWSNEISGIEVFQYSGDCVDLDSDNVCDDLEVFGCTNPAACNFDEGATEEAGTCEIVSCAGCTEPFACNFNPNATYPDASCLFPEAGYGCDGLCLSDADNDGVCDEFEVSGCTYPFATNYTPAATDDDGSCAFDGMSYAFGCTYSDACNFDANAAYDDGSCEFPLPSRTCNGSCINDQDGDNICDEFEGCTIPFACNYNAAAIQNNGCCIFPNPGADCNGNCIADSDSDGLCDAEELAGCTDSEACNFSQLATDDNGTCIYPAPGEDCNGNCLSDNDGDGVCNTNEVLGCMDDAACNFSPLATEPDGSCEYPDMYLNCSGLCLNDGDSDGVCDALEVPGCTYAIASNFMALATDDDGSCVFANAPSVPGCFYSNACNYNPLATINNGSCIFPSPFLGCDGNCLLDCDGDGICDAFEIAGCTDETACNFMPGATDSVDNCEFTSCAGCLDSNACNFDPQAPFDNGTCEFESCAGCMISTACNYDASATIAANTCEFSSCAGCTYIDADNYNPLATIDDGSCILDGLVAGAIQTGYASGYNQATTIAEEECDTEVLNAYNAGIVYGTTLGNGGPQNCGPGTIWNAVYSLCLPEPVCMGDLNNDNHISISDLLLLLAVFETDCE